MNSMEWNFLDADATYVYPSQNSSDGGNINSEQNVSNIADSLTYKAFVIRKGVYYPINGTAKPSDWDTNYKNYYIKEDHPGNSSTFYKRNTDSTWHSGTVYYLQEEPLKVTKGSGNNTINVTIGSAVLEGYQLNFDIIETEGTSQYIIKNYPLSDFTICELGNYLTEYKAIWNQLYTGNWVEKPLPKAVKESIKLPLLHVIVKLLKNATGNVRGDLVERDVTTDPPTVSKLCKGVAWAIATDADLENMTVPYLDLATIRLEPNSSVDKLSIHDIQNNKYKYTYIDQSSIITEGDQTTEEYIQNYVTEALDDLDHITYVTKNNTNDAKSRWIKLSVNKDNGVKVDRYTEGTGYDSDGNRNMEPDDGYDRSYSIDDIQSRTHPTSASSTTQPPLYDPVAHSVDSKDDGRGNYNYSSSVQNKNGSSKLLARADHDHSGMYLKSYGYGGNTQQETGPLLLHGAAGTVVLTVEGSSQLGSSKLVNGYPAGGNVVMPNGYLRIQHGGIEVNGPVTTSQQLTVGGSVDVAAQTHANGGLEVAGSLTGRGNGVCLYADGNVSINGELTANKVWNAVWNDYAELFLKDSSKKNYAPGTVICKVRGRDCYTESNADNRELVVGICSDSYGMLVGGKKENTLEQNLKEYIPVAVAGRVWANIRKGIYVREGDMLVVSRIDKGCVVPCDKNDLEFGTIVGKALSGNKDGKVLVLVSIM